MAKAKKQKAEEQNIEEVMPVEVESEVKSDKKKTEKVEKPAKKATKKSKFAKAKIKRSYNYKKAKANISKDKAYSVEEAIGLIKDNAYANFDESVEVHINLGTDSKNSDQRIRFTTSLPHGIGKSIRILVVSDKKLSVDLPNVIKKDSSVVQEILDGKLVPNKDFDLVIATPSVIKDLAKVAKILGPKGLMPSPKNNTITDNIEKAINEFAKGQVEVKSQAGHTVIHQLVGKLSFENKALKENIYTLIDELNRNTPSKLKKKLIQKVFVKSSMSPSVKVSL